MDSPLAQNQSAKKHSAEKPAAEKCSEEKHTAEKKITNKAYSIKAFTKKEYSRKALTRVTYSRKAFNGKAPFLEHLPTQVCLQKVVLLTYSWVINDKMDTILPIASSTWTFSTLNMDKIGLIVLQKRNQRKPIQYRAYSRKT